MAKKEPYDMTNSYARMERDKRKAIGNPNKNVHHNPFRVSEMIRLSTSSR